MASTSRRHAMRIASATLWRRMPARLLLTLLLAVALPGRVEGFPREITDALGRTVSIPAEPARIVSIFSSNTELLVALDLTARIVGIEDFTRYPVGIRDGRAIIGGRLGFSAEAIARLEPDLVVITPARQAAATLLRPMETAGIPVLVLLHPDLDSVFGNLTLLGQATGADTRAEAVIASLHARLDRVRQAIRDQPPRRVLLETGHTGRSGFLTARAGTYTADALAAAGGESIFPDLWALNQVSGEAIIQADPEVILLAHRQSSPADVGQRPGWHAISAVQSDAVHTVERSLLLIPGPRIIDGVEAMAALLHPDRFPP